MTKAELVTEIARKVQDMSYTSSIILGFVNDGLKDVAGQVLLPALRTSATITTLANSAQVPMPDDYQRELYHLYDTTDSRRLKVYRSMNLLAGAYPDVGNALLAATVEAAIPQVSKGTITLAGLPVADETFAIGTQTFTFKASGTATGDVVIGASAAATAANIVTSITRDIPLVATAAVSGDTVIVSSAAKTAAANLLTFTEAATNVTVDGSGYLGGTQQGCKTAWLKLRGTPTSAHVLTAHYFALPTPLSVDTDIPSVLPDQFHRKLLVNFAVKEIFTELFAEEDHSKIALWEQRYAQGLREFELFLGPYAREPEPINAGIAWDELE